MFSETLHSMSIVNLVRQSSLPCLVVEIIRLPAQPLVTLVVSVKVIRKCISTFRVIKYPFRCTLYWHKDPAELVQLPQKQPRLMVA